MELGELFEEIFRQIFAGAAVVEGPFGTAWIRRTSRGSLRLVEFEADRHRFKAIEQNPATSSRWARLAREGHQVLQIVDADTGRYVANVVDGRVRFYGERE